MKFEEVLPALRAGKEIKREKWKNPITKIEYHLSMDNILQEDWIIVEEEKKEKEEDTVCRHLVISNKVKGLFCASCLVERIDKLENDANSKSYFGICKNLEEVQDRIEKLER